MGDKAFVDTNILLRALNPKMPLHRDSEILLETMWQNDIELWVSRQVLREFLVQVTHPKNFSPILSISQVLTQLESVQTLFHVADETQSVTEQLINLLQKYPTGGKQIHDANIIATMLVYGIDTLLTINTEDFKRFSGQIRLLGLTPST